MLDKRLHSLKQEDPLYNPNLGIKEVRNVKVDQRVFEGGDQGSRRCAFREVVFGRDERPFLRCKEGSK